MNDEARARLLIGRARLGRGRKDVKIVVDYLVSEAATAPEGGDMVSPLLARCAEEAEAHDAEVTRRKLRC